MNKLKHERFHSTFKGCDMRPSRFRGSLLKPGKWHYIQGQYCKTHKKIVCKCGWEFSWHGGVKVRKEDVGKAKNYVKKNKSTRLFSGQ